MEIEWLKVLRKEGVIQDRLLKGFAEQDINLKLDSVKIMSSQDFQTLKNFESITRHDIKAVEYYLKEKLISMGFSEEYCEFVHFLCTSEDINNLAYSIMFTEVKNNHILKILRELIEVQLNLANKFKKSPMLSRTHGQAATPTTIGKEIANFLNRNYNLYNAIKEIRLEGKMNGAVGNYNSHIVYNKSINWINVTKEFIEKNLGLSQNLLTTQIEPHDSLVNLFQKINHLNTVNIGFCQDLWLYNSMNYLKIKKNEGEVGSSIMPHKVNPIDFENAEGNFGISNSMLEFFIRKLPISRLQRDLSDSTVLRNVGVALSHSYLALNSLINGLNKVEFDESFIKKDLNTHWEILAEPVQQLLRANGFKNPYEELKKFTRGKNISETDLKGFIDGLNASKELKTQLEALAPDRYTGLADVIVESLLSKIKF